MAGSQEEMLAKLNELLKRSEIDKGEKVLIHVLWASWFRGMSGTKAEATISSIASSWKHLEPLIGNRILDEITGEFWTNEIIPSIRAKTHQGIKFANDRKWLSMFMKWCDENNKGAPGWRRPRLIDPDPETEPGYVYSPEEMNRLVMAADWLLLPKIVMANPHFMRRSEIALMSKERIDRANRLIYLRAEDTKIRKPRIIPYNERLESLFVVMDAKHAELGIVSPWLFPSPINPMKPIGRGGFSTAWETCRRTAGVLEIGTFHDLRRTALTNATNADGANHMQICKVAGLAIEMLQRTYYIPKIEDLRKVIA